jgi:GTPase SAR1 family protein
MYLGKTKGIIMNAEQTEQKTRFQYVMETFFKEGTEINDIKGILQLGVESLKDYDDTVLGILGKLKIKKIKELVALKSESLQKALEAAGSRIDKPVIDYVMVSSKILRKLIEMKSKDKIEALPEKIAVMGMQNAGKTSLINMLSGNSTSEQFKETEPTVSVEQKQVKIGDYQLSIWDFGGQESFRNEYLQNPDEYFISTGMILFVLDIQEERLYADAIDYLYSILTIMNRMGQQLHILVDFHKFDPDIAEDVDVLVKVQWLEQKFKAVMENFNFSFEFIRTSLYSGIANSTEPDIARNLKEVFAAKAVDMNKLPEMQMLRNLVYVQTKIYYNLMAQLSEIGEVLKTLKMAPSPIAPALAPPGYTPPPQKVPAQPPAAFTSVNTTSLVSELKEAFKRRNINV